MTQAHEVPDIDAVPTGKKTNKTRSGTMTAVGSDTGTVQVPRQALMSLGAS